MDDQSVCEQDDHVEKISSPTSTPAVNTSPLSELSQTPSDGESRHADDSEGGQSQSEGEATVENDGDAAMGEDCSNEVFRCKHCGKVYNSQASLRSHLREKRSKCAKSRSEPKGRAGAWTCSRCHAHMAKKYSTERHIRATCWKICDECCEAGMSTCDGYNTEGICNNCKQRRLPCTKHKAPVSDSVAERLTQAPLQPNKSAPRTTRASPLSTALHETNKRKPVTTPEVSPKSRHMTKRTAPAIQQEHPERYAQDVAPVLNHTDPLASWTRNGQESSIHPVGSTHLEAPQSRFPMGPSFGMTSLDEASQPPQQSQGRYPILGHEPLPNSQSLSMQGYPNMSNTAMSNKSQNDTHSMPFTARPYHNANVKQWTQTLPPRQQQQLRDSVNASRHVPNPHTKCPPPVAPNPSLARIQPPAPAFNDIDPFGDRQDRFRPAQDRHFKSHMDFTNSAQQMLRLKALIASAPGSRMPSRQSTVEPEEDERVSSRKPPFEELRGMGRLPKAMPQRIVAGDSTQPIALYASNTALVHEDDPLLRLRIQTNTYDPNRNLIFSILTIRSSQKFGPRLDAYCAMRGKEFGKDWEFVYNYALREPNDKGHEKHIKITYNMTPEDVHDDQHPDIKIRDLDTILVTKARSPIAAHVETDHNGIATPLSQPGFRAPEETVDIMDGETKIYQNSATINKWQHDIETKMGELRAQTFQLNNVIRHQNNKLKEQETKIAGLELRNMYLTRAQASSTSLGQSHQHPHQYPQAQSQPPQPPQPQSRQPVVRPQTPEPLHQHGLFAGLSGNEIRSLIAHQVPASAFQAHIQQQQQHGQFPSNNENNYDPFIPQHLRPRVAEPTPFPVVIDEDGLPVFHGQDNPPPEFWSPGFVPPLSHPYGAQVGFWVPQNGRGAVDESRRDEEMTEK